MSATSKVIAILEDDPARAAAMKSALQRRLPEAKTIFFDNAPDMVAWLPRNLPTVCLLSLDHDLGPNRQRHGKVFDPGDGRDVVALLEGTAPTCRVLIHSSNGPAAEGMYRALIRSHWSVQRVYPFGDLAWVDTDWVNRVVFCVTYDPASTKFSFRPPAACTCFNQIGSEHEQGTPVLHGDQQDTTSAAWHRVCDRIERAIDSGERDFAPLEGLTGPERAEVITLPASIGRLVRVRKLNLFGSHLVRIPPEIGEMRSLADLDLYTSYRLHFLPFEILYCSNLRKSCFSTRALYGNYSYRPPFPDLTHSDNAPVLAQLTPTICSVCDAPLDPAAVVRRWITLRPGTDWLPLLVNACSAACIDALPTPPAGYVQYPHVGGAQLVQPAPDRRPSIMGATRKVIAILENDPARAAAMNSALQRRLPDAETVFFDNAPDMVAWLPRNLPTVCLLSLDHNLGPNRQRDGKVFDPGTGRGVVDLLEGTAPTCPVLIHSSNGRAAEGMFYALERSGWSAACVYHFKDLAWVDTDWIDRVVVCVTTTRSSSSTTARSGM